MRALVVACSLSCLVGASSARAQTCGEERLAEARALFSAAELACADERFDACVDGFRRSLELCARPSTAFNLAQALRLAGSAVEARDVARRALDGSPEADAAVRTRIEQLLAELEADVGRLHVRVLGPVELLLVDGNVLALDAAGEAEVEVEHGPHELVALDLHGERTVRRVEVDAPRSDVLLDLTPAGPSTPGTATNSSVAGIESEPAFWLLLGLGAAVAAGAIVGGVLAEEASRPLANPVFGRIEALRF